MIPFWAETSRQIQIRHKGRAIWLHPIHGLPKTILVHPKSRRFYESYWEEGDDPGDRKTREWRCYHNIWSLHRGLELARIRAIKQRLPLLQELYDQCATSAAQLLGPNHRRPETLREVAEFAAHFLDAIRAPQTHALRAAQAQVAHAAVPTDSLGRHNPRARAARLVQVSGRHLPQRIGDIIGWLGHYAHWADDVGRLLEFAGGFLAAMGRRIGDLWMLANTTSDRAKCIRCISSLESDLRKLLAFGGWSAWARWCLADLRELRRILQPAHPSVNEPVLDRLAAAVTAKQLQSKLSGLLLDLEVDHLLGQSSPERYFRRFIELRLEVNKLWDGNLRQPVKEKLLTALSDAETVAGDFAKPAQIRAARNHLRAACNAL